MKDNPGIPPLPLFDALLVSTSPNTCWGLVVVAEAATIGSICVRATFNDRSDLFHSKETIH
jgi:hypothetical protein